MSNSSQRAPSLASSWRPQLKHAVKTGTAAVLAAACHQALPFMGRVPAAWAALAAVIVMQSNLGSTWKASGSGFVGTIIGGLVGATVAWLGGTSLFWFWSAACGAVLLCSSLRLHDAVRLAGVTLALVMLSGTTTNPWTLGWQRSLDVALGIVAAVVVQLVLWPSRADMELRLELGRSVAGCKRLYEAAVTACLQSTFQPLALEELRADVEQRIARVRSLVEDVRYELLPNRTDDTMLIHLVSQVDAVEHHVSAVDFSAAEMEHDTYYRQIESPLKNLACATIATFDWLAKALGTDEKLGLPPDLNAPLSAAKQAEERLRQTRTAANFGDDEILRFCTFFFSMEAVCIALRSMTAALAHSRIQPSSRRSKTSS